MAHHHMLLSWVIAVSRDLLLYLKRKMMSPFVSVPVNPLVAG